MTMTPHKDINDILTMLANGLQEGLGDQLVGLYLTGSLTYGDFNRGSSDIDFLAVLTAKLSPTQRDYVRQLHEQIAKAYPTWAARIEGSYITKDMLASLTPPQQARPYVNLGKLWKPDPAYGNEWLINLASLREYGKALTGPEAKELVKPIDPALVRQAARGDFYTDREPLLADPTPLQNSHYQAYTILALCRILHNAKNGKIVSKHVAATWFKQIYGERWRDLIEQAEGWQHGQNLDRLDDTLAFIRFVRAELETNHV